MNRGHVLQSSPVQQMMAAGNPNWWNINNMRPPPHHHQPTSSSSSSSPFLPPPGNFFPQFAAPTSSSSSTSSWHDHNQELPAESWSQLLLYVTLFPSLFFFPFIYTYFTWPSFMGYVYLI